MGRAIGIIALLVLLIGMLGCGSGSSGSSGSISYVAIGASDATGVGATPITNGYVYRLRDLLNEDGWDVDLANLGIPGARVKEMREVELPVARRLDPSHVTIFAGGNDLVQGVDIEDFERDLAAIFAGLTDDTEATLAIATLPDMTRLPRFLSDPDQDVTPARVAAFNDIILRQAARAGALIADLRTFAPDADVTASDGFHPNDRGHELIAQEFYNVLQGSLRGR